MTIMHCPACDGEGTYDNEPCDACAGSGNALCDRHGCNEAAVVFNEDGEALCEDCYLEWQNRYGGGAR